MPRPPDNLLTPEDEELARKQSSLADLEAQLADRELELATFSADLFHFEARYLQTIGRRYALLDELQAFKARWKERLDQLEIWMVSYRIDVE